MQTRRRNGRVSSVATKVVRTSKVPLCTDHCRRRGRLPVQPEKGGKYGRGYNWNGRTVDSRLAHTRWLCRLMSRVHETQFPVAQVEHDAQFELNFTRLPHIPKRLEWIPF